MVLDIFMHTRTLAARTYACAHTHTHVNLDFEGKQDNEPESPLFYFHRKKASQVGFEPTTSCFQGSCLHAHTYACAHTCKHAHTYAHTYARKHTRMHVHTHISDQHTHISDPTHTHLRPHTHTCVLSFISCSSTAT